MSGVRFRPRFSPAKVTPTITHRHLAMDFFLRPKWHRLSIRAEVTYRWFSNEILSAEYRKVTCAGEKHRLVWIDLQPGTQTEVCVTFFGIWHRLMNVIQF
jgi:hypothetical protein